MGCVPNGTATVCPAPSVPCSTLQGKYSHLTVEHRGSDWLSNLPQITLLCKWDLNPGVVSE